MQDAPQEPYKPIACSFYDEIGLRMLRRQPCRLTVEGGDGTRRTVETRIEDVYTEGAAEYARLADGAVVRLDRIVRIDEVDRPTAC